MFESSAIAVVTSRHLPNVSTSVTWICALGLVPCTTACWVIFSVLARTLRLGSAGKDDDQLNHLWQTGPLFTKQTGVLQQDLVKSRKPRDSGLDFSNRSEILQALQQQYCRDACLI